MKKIGFVTPWYGDNIAGGSEALLRDLVKYLYVNKVDLEILTTCVEKYASDWSVNFYKKGCTLENGISVRRFTVRRRNNKAFNAVHDKLRHDIKLTEKEEAVYAREMINSPRLYRYLKEKADDYSLFVFIPYMFGTTYHGIAVNPSKSVLIPCFHDESYIYLQIFKKLFPTVKGMIFNAAPEAALAQRVYDLSKVVTETIGIGIEFGISGCKADFLNKYRIKCPFILYAGRKDVGKNVNLLLAYFSRYKQINKNKLQLVLIGGGSINIPDVIKNDVFDLGFVPLQDKFDAYSAAMLLCQPSANESFSLVIMESWGCGRPVLVNADCAVTKDFVQKSNGGLYFRNYQEFEGCVNYVLNNQDAASIMGEQGRQFVIHNFSWNVITEKYINYFRKLCG